MIGTTVGRYLVVGKLGQGGMGVVWKAEDTLLGRAVALKFLPEALADSPEARRRLLHEARATSSLDHPGVATVYDAGEADGRLYIAVAYIAGATVSELAARGPLPVPEALRIAAEAGEALGHAHERGVLHRDVTGRNIMVSDTGRVVVVDFGLALKRGASRLTPSGAMLGAVGYLAPEVALGGEPDHRSDLYGLGVVLYEMLTGELPHPADRLEAMLYSVAHREPPPPGGRRAGLSPEVDRLVVKALAREPALRYQSAREMVSGLRVAARTRAAGRRPGHRARAAGRTPVVAVRPAAAPAAPSSRSIAVLPFRDVESSSDGGLDRRLLALGLAETLAASLGRYSGVQVIPPAAAPDTAADSDARAVGRLLGADLVLSGSIRGRGERLRVAYTVLHAERATQIAGGTIEGSPANLLDVEDRLVRRVVRSLELRPADAPPAEARRPGDPAAREHYLQALGYLVRHDDEASVDGATELLERLRHTEGEAADILSALGRAYLAKYRLTHQRIWEERAAAACRRAVEVAPTSSDVQLTLGQVHAATGRYGEAVRAYRRALQLNPRAAEALLGMSAAFEAAGESDRAEAACFEAIAQRPGDWRGHSRLGVLRFNRGQYERAIEPWRRAVELAPGSARSHSNLAAALFHLGRHDEAIASYRRSLEIQPNAGAYTSLGTVHFFLGNYHEAAAMFERGAALRPYDPTQWGNLADAYRWMPGEEERAATAYAQAIALAREDLGVNPRDGARWGDLAVWLAKSGRTREAVRGVRRALRLSPENVNCMAAAGTVHHLAGDREKALEWLGRAARNGYDVGALDRDPEFASLRADPAYRQAVRETGTG